MKKQFLFILLLALAITTFSQQTAPSPNLSKQEYLKKSKKQKPIAWILLGTGTALIVTGFSIGLNDAAEAIGSLLILEPKSSPNTGEILFWAGLATAAGSIPFFIASGKNRKKAMSLSFKNQMAPQLVNQAFVYRPVPSLTFKVSL